MEAKTKKIACCVLTFNGADIIRDVLQSCAGYYFEAGIDVYYFDASCDDSTKQVIEEYRKLGYTNLYHFHMPDASSLERTEKMMSGEWFAKDYDYIWPSKNRSFLSEAGIQSLLKAVEEEPDVIVCSADASPQVSVETYTDPVALYRDEAWIMTSLDTVLYRQSTVFDHAETQEIYVGFNEFYSYIFNRMPDMEHLKVSVLRGQDMDFINSKLGHSGYNVVKTWKDFWIAVNEQLPSCYDAYKGEVIKNTAKLPWLIGGLGRTYALVQQKLIRMDNLDEVRNNWEKVSDVPFELVEKMAAGGFDIYHDMTYLNSQDEFLKLIKGLVEYVRIGAMPVSDVPFDAVIDVLMNKAEQKNAGDFDYRIVQGTLSDIQKRCIRADMTIEECCMYLQMCFSFGLLL